jgi:hypothetical protein
MGHAPLAGMTVVFYRMCNQCLKIKGNRLRQGIPD